METATTGLGLLAALGLMTAGAEAVVRGASGLAFRLGLSSLFVGLTVVAIGTSSPELASSVLAALRGSPDVAVGNVVGSNIFNVCVILGLAALIKPIAVSFSAIRQDVLVACAAATLPWLAVPFDGSLPRWIGAAMLLALAAYTYTAFRAGQRAADEEVHLAERELENTPGIGNPVTPSSSLWPALRDAGLVVAGLLFLVLGASWFVSSAITVARGLGISELVIGLTVVAAGTSMPELLTSTVAAIRGQADIAVGNVVGSNIFNILGVLGATALISPQAVSPQILTLDTPVMLAASLALLPIVRTGGRISRAEGAFLLTSYVVYVGVLVKTS